MHSDLVPAVACSCHFCPSLSALRLRLLSLRAEDTERNAPTIADFDKLRHAMTDFYGKTVGD